MNDARCSRCDHYAKELVFYEGRTTQMKAEIAALQLERDALMEAVEIYERLLHTPASGEPARKP